MFYPNQTSLHEDTVKQYHTHIVLPKQCSSSLVQFIDAPVGLVWSFVGRFNKPQAYKHFIRGCSMYGDGSIGSVREVQLVSGMPATTSTERLDVLNEEGHIISFSIVGGDHRLTNYRSTTTLHEEEWGGDESKSGTVVMESYVVDVPYGTSREDTCLFIDTIVRCNLKSLAQVSERLAMAPTNN